MAWFSIGDPCLLSGRAGLGLGLRSPLFLLIAICNNTVHAFHHCLQLEKIILFHVGERRGGGVIYVGLGEEGREIIKQWESKKK
jgi:hypothetical protein